MAANRKKLSAKAPLKKSVPKKPAKKAASPAASPKRAKTPAKPAKTPARATAKNASARPAKPAGTLKKAAKAGSTGAGTTKIPPRSTAAAKGPPLSALKGLTGISGAKAARIARIVAESVPARPAPPPPASVHDAGEALATVHKAAAVLFAKKAEEVVLMDLRNLSTVADYYLIATCRNEPQMRAILGSVRRELSREGIKALRSEYMPGVRWAVVDFGDVILHLFERQTRGFYSLERLWADAPSTPLRAEDYPGTAAMEETVDDDDL
jgi:ribosome-associated protein